MTQRPIDYCRQVPRRVGWRPAGLLSPRPMSMLLPILLAWLAAVPAFLLRFGALALPVELATLGFGLGVVGAAFAMLWAAEAAERDVPRALALTPWRCWPCSRSTQST